MKKWIQGTCVAVLGAGLFFSSGCVSYNKDIGYHDYDYYPDINVYYLPEGRIYYWNENGHWVSGDKLPDKFDLRERKPQHLRHQGQEPWNDQK